MIIIKTAFQANNYQYKWKYKVKKLDANSLKIVDNKYNKAEL